jgi:isocitrate lyase
MDPTTAVFTAVKNATPPPDQAMPWDSVPDLADLIRRRLSSADVTALVALLTTGEGDSV